MLRLHNGRGVHSTEGKEHSSLLFSDPEMISSSILYLHFLCLCAVADMTCNVVIIRKTEREIVLSEIEIFIINKCYSGPISFCTVL